MSEERVTRLWWHQRQDDSLPSRRVFDALRASYDPHRWWMREIAALGEFALRIERCRQELKHWIRHHAEPLSGRSWLSSCCTMCRSCCTMCRSAKGGHFLDPGHSSGTGGRPYTTRLPLSAMFVDCGRAKEATLFSRSNLDVPRGEKSDGWLEPECDKG